MSSSPSIFDSVRAWIEICYLASGPALFIVGLFGLRQLRISQQTLDLTRKEVEIRSKREAVVLAAQQCENCVVGLIPHIEKCRGKLQALGILHQWRLKNTDFTLGSITERVESQEWLTKFQNDEESTTIALAALNRCESFAMYFANGAADETVAFPAIGDVFCAAVEILAPFLIALREQNIQNTVSGPFENTLTLYRTWYVRAEQAKNHQKSEALRVEASKGQVKKPIGT